MDCHKETLENGVRVLLVPMPYLNSVTVMIGVGAGSRFEEARVQGIAHFTEHMIFKGTKRRPSPMAVSSELESLGAVFNAFTSQEITNYFVKAAAQNLSRALDILADVVFKPLLKGTEIEKERKVILEEQNMVRDDPKDWILRLFEQVCFGDQPLGRDTLGTKETVLNIKRQDFLNYIGEWYRTRNITLAIAGKFDRSQAIGEVLSFLGDLPDRKVGSPIVARVSSTLPQILVEERKIDQTHFVLGTWAYNRSHPKREALEVLTTILGGGTSARLWQEIREKRGLAYDVRSTWWDYSDVGLFLVHAGVNSSHLGGSIKVVLDVLGKVREKLVSAEELKRAKEMIGGRILLGIEPTDGACEYYLEQEVLEGKIETPEEKIRKINAVTAEDVQKVAQELFVENGLNLAVIGPNPDSDRLHTLLKFS